MCKKGLRISQVDPQARACPMQFLYHEATRNICTLPWMGCYSIAGLPYELNLPVSICAPGWGGAL